MTDNTGQARWKASVVLVAFAACLMPATAYAGATVVPLGGAARSTLLHDLNGDGYPDLVIAGQGTVAVYLSNGSAALDMSHPTVIRPTLVGFGADFASFGTSVAEGDFNRDGYTDLAIGSGVGLKGAGSAPIVVLYGGPNGPSTHNSHQIDPPSTGKNSGGGSFGEAIAVGDINGDGYADLIAGVPWHSGPGGEPAGEIATFFGTSHGLRSTADQVLTRSSLKLHGAGHKWGTSIATGDFNGDGYDDVAVASPRATISGVGDAGRVDVLHGFHGGLRVGHVSTFSTATRGFPGSAKSRNELGEDMVTADINHDGSADLVLGGPTGDSSVTVLYGGSAGLSTRGAQRLTLGSKGVPGADRPNNGFGGALAVVSGGNGYPILFIGVGQYRPASAVPGPCPEGALISIRGSAHGLSAHSSTLYLDPTLPATKPVTCGELWGDYLGGGSHIVAAQTAQDTRVLHDSGPGPYGSVDVNAGGTVFAY